MSAFGDALKQLNIGDALVRRNPLFYGRALERLVALQAQRLEARRDWTGQRLRKVLQAARRTAYGRKAGATAELASWPLLEKAQLRAAPQAFCPTRLAITAKGTTGGSTGLPLVLTRSLQNLAFEQATLDYLRARLGVRPNARIAVLRADSVKDPADRRPPFWVLTHGGERMVMSPHHLCADTVGDYVRALHEFHPDLLWVYPTALESLSRLVLEAGLDLHIARVHAASEGLAPRSWELARRALGGPAIVENYGQAERVAFAIAYAPGVYHFLAGYSKVELLPVAEEGAETVYEIVGTSLWNLAQPLVRYRTGDLVRLPAEWGARELEEVALGARPFGGVLGRSGEFLLTPEGVRITGINHFPREVGNVHRIQVIQERVDDVRVLVLADKGYGARDGERLLANVRAKLPGSMRVTVQVTDRLERTAGGKTPFVIHREAVRRLLEGAPTSVRAGCG